MERSISSEKIAMGEERYRWRSVPGRARKGAPWDALCRRCACTCGVPWTMDGWMGGVGDGGARPQPIGR
eukprot:scaffold2696_cov333-Pavlova_lutheri.AAC.8